MALPASGPISFNAINVELGVAGTTQASLGQASYRSLAGVASGAISLSNFYGKSSQFAFNLTTAVSVNLRNAAIAAGWNQTSALQATIPSGNTISSSSSGGAALSISGSFPGGVTLINNGTIVGAGGAGGGGGSYYGSSSPAPEPYRGYPGTAGGTAISVSSPVSINNAGTIAGGGGGGGGGGLTIWQKPTPKGINTAYYAGGGGGGGAGTIVGAGGAGGGGGQGNNSVPGFAGSAGTSTTGGAGGTTNPAVDNFFQDNPSSWGGAGGNLGQAGAAGIALASNMNPPNAGGAGGYYVTGNSNVTWIATGTRLGNVS